MKAAATVPGRRTADWPEDCKVPVLPGANSGDRYDGTAIGNVSKDNAGCA